MSAGGMLMRGSRMRRQVLLLTGAQALCQTVSVLVMTIGGLAGAAVAPTPQLATAPIAAMILGMALMIVPASMVMGRKGGRFGFILGALLGAFGGGLSALGLAWGSLWILCGGTLLVGAYQSFAQFYRFAAADAVEAEFKTRAISWVLTGGIVAALAGPFLAQLGSDWVQPPFTGSFIILAGLGLGAALLLTFLRLPHAVRTTSKDAAPRPLRVIMAQPVYLVALFSAATGAGVMILCMTATPLAMLRHSHDVADAAWVIQAHVLGMFLPSFATGSLIARFGVLRIMMVGIGLLAGHIALTFAGTGFHSFLMSLAIIGVGWNFLYIGGTTLLTGTYTESEKARAQAANDLTIFATGLVSSVAAAPLLDLLGWQMLNLMLLPWLGTAALMILVLAYRRRHASA